MKPFFKNSFVFRILDNHTEEVARNSIASLSVKIVGLLFSFLISIFLGRTIGSDGLGILNLSNRIVTILSIVTLFGMGQIIIKEIAVSITKKDFEHISNIIYSSILLNVLGSAILTIVVILFAPTIAETFFNDSRLTFPLIILIISLSPQILSRIYSSGLMGYGKIWQSNLVENTLSMLFVFFFLFILWELNYKITVIMAAVVFSLGKFSVTIVLRLYWKKVHSIKTPQRNILKKKLLKSAYSVFLASVGVMIMTNSDIVILGFFRPPSDIGIYSVAFQLSQLTRFILIATNSSISPKIAALSANNRKQEIKTMIRKVNFGLLIVSFFPFLLFLFFGKHILSLWGAEFVNAYFVLIILSIGQVFNVSMGTSTPIMIMSGFEKENKTITLVFAVINLLLMYLFVVKWGVIGAAVITSIILAGRNITQVLFIKFKMKLNILPQISKDIQNLKS